jgi:Zn-dependent metalloprotease
MVRAIFRFTYMIKNFTILIFAALVCCFPAQVFGQKKKGVSSTYLVNKFKFYENNDSALNHENFFRLQKADMHLAEGSEMVLKKTFEGKNGFVHYRYQQFHLGLEVVGSQYILHEANGRLVRGTGRYTPQIEATATTSLSSEGAIFLAKQEMKAEEYSSEPPATKLCFIDAAYPKVSNTILLAFQIDLESVEPFKKERYYVDARKGKVLAHLPLLLEEGVPSKAQTFRYGEQNIVTDSLAPQKFELHDPTRGIYVYNAIGEIFTSKSSNWDLTNQDRDEVALDAHYCTQELHDMLQEEFTWSGLDGQGAPLKVKVHRNDAGTINAFWDGEYSNYGDGSCAYHPLTTLEVVGHEFMHGIIDQTSQLEYWSESGAINESMADMMGKRLEYEADFANFSWLLGKSFFATSDAEPFRVMNDPHVLEMPALYNGQYWTASNGVHTNSSIGNLWFSMIVDGKQGTNEVGTTYNVAALGMAKAGLIAFETNKNYLTASSNYNDFYQFSVAQAEDLFGAGSVEVLAVKEAWKAVGLPAQLPTGVDLAIAYALPNSYYTCIKDQFYPLLIQIENLGSQTYNPATNGFATLKLSSIGLSDRNITVSDPIAPGEVVDFLVDDWIYIDNPTTQYISVIQNLEFTDINPDNQSTSWNTEVLESDSNDLYISFLNSSNPECFNEESTVNIFFTNNSCSELPTGTVITYRFKDVDSGTELLTILDTIGFALPPKGFMYRPVKISTTANYLLVSAEIPNDVDPSNNSLATPIVKFNTLATSHYNNFEQDPTSDNYLNIDKQGPELLLTHQGSQHFGAVGSYSPEFVVSCPSPDDFFDVQDYSISNTIMTCLDYSAFAAPSASFDLRLFKSDFAQQENYDYSSMLQVQWKGTDDGYQIIYDQPQGSKVSHQVALPPNFKGTFKLRFFAQVGSWQLSPSALSTDDVILLDNLRLHTQVSGTQEDTPSVSPISIQPNPALDRVVVQATQPIEHLRLCQMNGQQLRLVPVNGTWQALDLQGLPSGFYLLDILLQDGQRVVEKVVKM